jgi:hypothetical protein
MPPMGDARTSFGVYAVAEQDARGALNLDQSVGFLRRQVRRLPPSWLHRMGRLKARMTSLGARPKPSPGESGAHDRVLMDNPDESLKNLHHCRAQLVQAQTEIATLLQDYHSVREQHAELAGHVAHLVQHNQLLTEAATERARELQEQASKLTQAYVEIETLSKENQRLRAEHAAISRRAAELEAHNSLLTTTAIERETKLQDCAGKLAQALNEVTSLSRDNEYVRVEHALHAQRAAELQDHNQLLTETATETARELQRRDAELTKALIEIATLSPENKRLHAEHAFYAKRAAELEEHNRLLTESATEQARKLRHCEDKLTQLEGELATARRENQHFRAKTVVTAGQAERLERRLIKYRDAIETGVYLLGVDSSDLSERVQVPREEIGNPAVFLIIGQSNAGNHGQTRFSAEEAVFNFNPFNGLCYRARDPLLGTTGDGGSPWCLLGDALIRSGFARSILLCPLSVGGATVAEWAPGGPYHQRLTYGIDQLRAGGFLPSHILWHQGEADALNGTSPECYVRSFSTFVDSLRSIGVMAPIYIARASYFAVPVGHTASQNSIREAQRSLIDSNRAILAGPDTDTITDRFDGCHMGESGLKDHARAWQVILEGSLGHLSTTRRVGSRKRANASRQHR